MFPCWKAPEGTGAVSQSATTNNNMVPGDNGVPHVGIRTKEAGNSRPLHCTEEYFGSTATVSPALACVLHTDYLRGAGSAMVCAQIHTDVHVPTVPACLPINLPLLPHCKSAIGCTSC